MADSFREVLANTSALDLIQKGRSLYVVSKDATVEETLQVMARNGVVSVPVRDTEEDTAFNNFVDTSDILAFLASLCKDTNSLVQLKVETFTNQKVGDIVNMSNKDPFISVPETESATKVLELFSEGIHRVALKDAEGHTTNVLSQIDLLRYVVNKMSTIEELAKKSVKELGLVQSWVLQVRKTERAFACFKKMSENGVNGVSIVDNVGRLDAHISSGSLRGLTAETFKALRLPVEDFLAAQKIEVGNSHTCTGSDTFEVVLRKLNDLSTHRLWVQDAAGNPVGIISLTDVCSVLRKQ